MITVKVLKRKDGASLVVGVIVALILSAFINSVTRHLADLMSGAEGSLFSSWGYKYIQPLLWAILQLLMLELLLWLYVWVATQLKQKS